MVEDYGGISVIRGGGNRRAWNGIQYLQGMSGKNVGSTSLSINVATVPPGAIAYAHIHDGFEVMLFILQGKVKHTLGENLEKEVINQAGDFNQTRRAARGFQHGRGGAGGLCGPLDRGRVGQNCQLPFPLPSG